MPNPPWNDRYAAGEAPWDTGEPDEHLVAFVRAARIAPCAALEVGSGTGTNAAWLAQQGFEVLGVDLSPIAVERARSKASGKASCRFEVRDFLADPPPGTFGFVFDRGCFHVFDDAAERARFAERVAERLAPGGMWLSLIGSTEGPPRDIGPPRRNVREVVGAIEPVLAIEELVAVTFGTRDERPTPAAAWRCLARRREVPAQPSSRRPG